MQKDDLSSQSVTMPNSVFHFSGFLKKSLLEKPSDLMSQSPSFLSLTGFSLNQVIHYKDLLAFLCWAVSSIYWFLFWLLKSSFPSFVWKGYFVEKSMFGSTGLHPKSELGKARVRIYHHIFPFPMSRFVTVYNLPHLNGGREYAGSTPYLVATAAS